MQTLWYSYGIGYHLTIEKHNPEIDSEVIIRLAQDTVTKSKVLSDIGSELTLLLPDESTYQFPVLLDALESI